MKNKLIIIDISNYIFRAFYAIRPLNAPDGTPVNAVYGVLSMIHNMIVKYQPTHILVAKDTKEGSFRNEIYPEYKANRSAPPDDLIPQFGLVDELIKALGLPEIKAARYEADDVIGSVAIQWKNDFEEILIASGDKDLMQFVDGPIKMLDTMKEIIYSREEVKDKMGVYPEQIVDYLSLIGDSSDNIPGVPGIGPKGAQGLLEEFGTLDKVLENVNIIKNKRCQTALLEHKDKAILSKELAQIVTDLKLNFDSHGAAFQLKLTPEVEEFFNKVGFKSWQTKLADYRPKVARSSEAAAPLYAAPYVPPPATDAKKVRRWTLADFKNMIAGVKTFSINPVLEDELNQRQYWKAMAVATDKACGYLALTNDEVPTFFDVIKSTGAIAVLHQSKPLLQLAMMAGVDTQIPYFDLSQAHFIINPEYRHDLGTMTEEFLGQTLAPTPKGQTGFFDEITDDELTRHGEKAEAILKLHSILREKMKAENMEKAYDELDIPMIKVLAAMELEGIALDIGFYKELEYEFQNQIDDIENEVKKIAGDKINLRSPKQVGELLFEKLQLPVIRKTKTGYSTDAEVLAELAALKMSPVPEQLLKYREIEKLLSTYVKALPIMVNSQTHKIHTHFQPSNAATGRLSSDNPNLQNIPVRTENGRKLRKGFIPSKGRTLLSADYSQVELRLLAHFSQDKNMLEAFKHDLDIHKQTASEIFEVPLDTVTKDMRNSAKAINFGLMYGQTSFGLSQTLHISQGDAKKYITAYFKKFSSVKSFLDTLKEKAEDTGYAETLFGRKRALPDIKSTNRQVKAMAERVAINSPIQGTAADVIKLAMINIQRILKERNLKSKMVLQVHDELIFDVEPSEMDEMKTLVKTEMEGAVNLTVQLKVEMGTGQNWYDLK